jgi:type I restriction enzyme, S subunit
MKNGWQTQKLGDVCDFEGGSQPPKSQFVFEEKPGYVRFLQIRDFGSDKNITYIPKSKKNRLCEENDILIGRYGASVGKILTNKAGAYNVALMKTIPNLEVLNRSWFYNYLISDEFQSHLLKVADRSAQAGFSKDDICNFPVPAPPLSEQQRIVGILDEAFEGIATAKANADKNLQNARALFESHLQAVLRSKKWKWKTLGELCDDVEYGSSAKSKTDGKVPVLRMGNIQNGRLDWANLAYTDDKAEIKKYLLKHNDVLFNRTNSPELVGKTAIYKSEMPAIFAGYLIRIHRKENLLDADYLTYFLNSQIAFDYGKTVVISSVNQANINGTKLKSYPIPAPSLSEQKVIVAKLDELAEETQRLTSVYDRKLAALDALKKSLLHQAFSGQL